MHAHPDAPPVAITGKKPLYRQLYFWVLVGIVAGILVGWLVRDSARFWHVFGYEPTVPWAERNDPRHEMPSG